MSEFNVKLGVVLDKEAIAKIQKELNSKTITVKADTQSLQIQQEGLKIEKQKIALQQQSERIKENAFNKERRALTAIAKQEKESLKRQERSVLLKAELAEMVSRPQYRQAFDTKEGKQIRTEFEQLAVAVKKSDVSMTSISTQSQILKKRLREINNTIAHQNQLDRAKEKALKKEKRDLEVIAKQEKEALQRKERSALLQAELSEMTSRPQYRQAFGTKEGKQIKAEFEQLAVAVKKGEISMASASTQSQILKKRLGELNNKVRGTGQSMASAAAKVLTWGMATSAIYFPIRTLRNMITEVKELDKALVELSKVTNFAVDGMDSITKSAFELGEQIGKTGVQVVDALTEFSKAGYGIQEAFELSEQALVMTNIGDGINDVATASGVLISAMKAYGIEANNSVKILDVLNEVSNNAAVNFDDLASMLKRSGAVLAQTGNTLEESVGLMTGAFEILRDEKVATSLRTLSLRLRSMNEEGEYVALVGSKLQKSFREIAGIDITDLNGDLRSTFDIISDLAAKQDEISETDMAYLFQQAAGKRQADALAAILTNWDSVEDAVKSATNSMGSAATENAKYMQSIEAATNRLRSAFSQLATNTIDSELVKSFVNLITTLVKLVDVLGVQNVAIAGLLFIAPQLWRAVTTLATRFNKLGLAMTKSNLILAALSISFLAIVKIVDKFSDRQQKLADSLSKSMEAGREQADTLRRLKDEYAGLLEVEELTTEQLLRLIEIEQTLADKYDITTSALDKQNMTLEDRRKLLEEIGDEELRSLQLQQAEGLVDYNKALKELKKEIDLDDDAEIALRALGLKVEGEALIPQDAIKLLEDAVIEASKMAADATVPLTEGIMTIEYTREDILKRLTKELDKQREEYGSLIDVATDYEALENSINNIVADRAKNTNDAIDGERDLVALRSHEITEYLNAAAETKTKLDELIETQRKLGEGGVLTGREIMEMLANYPELIDKITQTTDGFTVSLEALSKIRDDLLEEQRLSIFEQEGLISKPDEAFKPFEESIRGITTLTEAQAFATNLLGSEYEDIGATLVQVMQLMEAMASINPLEDAISGIDALEEQAEEYAKFIEDINDELKAQIDIHKEAIDNYKEQINQLKEAHKEERAIADAKERALAIDKARLNLLNTQAERNVWQFTEEGWELVADASAVQKAQEELDKLLQKEEEIAAEQALAEEIGKLEDKIAQENKAIDVLESTLNRLGDIFKEGITDYQTANSILVTTLETLLSGESLATLFDTVLKIDTPTKSRTDLLDKIKKARKDDTTITVPSGGTTVAPIKDKATDILDRLDGLGAGIMYDEPSNYMSDRIADRLRRLGDFASELIGGTTSNTTYDQRASFAGANFNVQANNAGDLIRDIKGRLPFQ